MPQNNRNEKFIVFTALLFYLYNYTAVAYAGFIGEEPMCKK